MLGALLLTLPACGGGDDVVLAAISPTDACKAVAADPEVTGGGGAAELVRAGRTTQSGLAAWLAGRNGPDGPSVTASPTGDPAAPIDVCVFRSTVSRPISMPPGATNDTTGVSVFVRSGGVTLDAIGDPDRLAKRLDSLP